ncbi:late embryogenesis abundant protein [Striga asiatica]|uniref:Late embryogenesis abundant protein n=1 Tax=Striga asiatica TaxID=4170 RepID=A0A5A7QTB0_STRAF|nr:late embryogenesis abundant protein [Striga asiatica]
MHAKTDSDATSFAPSSPDHNRRPVYYVQSPSRDSHDGEKTNTASFHSTPAIGSPMGSPPHSHSSVGQHSRESSTSRFSGSLKPGSKKINPNNVGSGGRGHRKGGQDNWKEFDVIEEEGLLEDEGSRQGLPRRCYILAFAVSFFALFSLFALILYGASKPQKPIISVRSVKFERFVVQAGSDDSGVSTDMISINATVKFTFRNTATFFGVHVSSTPLALSYSQLNIGSGDMKKFYQKRESHRNVSVIIIGDKIPLYGSGAALSTPTGITNLPIPLNMEFRVRSRAYVLGKLVKPKFYKKIVCSITFDAKELNVPISLKNSCTYD